MKNKNKKQLPLLLLALLFITAAAYGTRAYFTDDASQEADIKLTLGNLDIENVESKWVYKGEGNTTLGYSDGTKIPNAEDIKNVQPGDSFKRTFKFINNGSLNQKVTVVSDILAKEATAENPFVVNVDPIITGNTTVLEKGQTINFDVTITVPGTTAGEYDVDGSYNVSNLVQTNNPDKYSLDYLAEIITVTAVQTNR